MENYTLPRGTQDYLPEKTLKLNYIEDVLKQIAALFDYHEIRTPIFEHTGLFLRSVGESSDIVNKEMYTFLDRSNRSITLRPEGTAGVIRAFVENKLYTRTGDFPIKLYYNGPVFRYERPQAGRYRQIHQFGFEAIGIKSHFLDVEVILAAASALYYLGIKDFKVKVNSIGDRVSREAYVKALKTHFEPSLATLCPDCQRRYEQNALRILDCKVDASHPAVVSAPKINDYLNEESKAYFAKVIETLKMHQLPYEIDYSLVRGLDYYSDTVFEIVPTNMNYGAICAGGRYDYLVEEIGGPSLPSVGFAFGVDRLLLALDELKLLDSINYRLDAYVMPLDQVSMDFAYQVTQYLRGNGLRAELDYQMRSLKAQFKSVEKKNAAFAIIIGEKETQDKTVVVKNTKSKEQVSVTVNDLIPTLERLFNEEYIKAQQASSKCSCNDNEHDHHHECDCNNHNHK